ncbi:alpha-E domain-containing protein [Cohnella cholangitidis]|uniref:Alpha-E domain-containing protein n=1 Tax=Cohnella cholangitidis TaxID=2598458 RepID=A0A7G5BXV3_9BACL|nr:alpha-E domain-containing protein [Cohnella cholangitidis]QMV41787.1 alpha-E domain-containing protein [Cohnella cholangitidis]
MLDRIAESLFWIGRYTERAENHARLLDVYYHLREGGGEETEAIWKRIAEAIGDCALYEERYEVYREYDVLFFLTLDPTQANSILSCVAQARDNLKKIREQLPSELWNLLNGFYLWLKGVRPEEVIQPSPHRFFQRVKEGLAAFQGTATSLAMRDQSWNLLESGRYLERSENVVRLLQSVGDVSPEQRKGSYAYTIAVLKSVGGYEAFRRLDLEEITLEEVARFLVLQESFPRSVHFALTTFDRHLKAMRDQSDKSSSALERMIRLAGKARSELGWLDRNDITMDTLASVLQQLLNTNKQLGEAVAKYFFSPGREVIA